MNFVSFGPEEVREAMSGKSGMACRLAVLTSQTCSDACWYAREDVCRCSCGGKNHGCLLVHGAEQPVRTARIDGVRYKLAVVGEGALERAGELNARQMRSVEKPFKDQSGHWHQYRYRWTETAAGAPGRVKWATPDQIARWPELAAWRGQPDYKRPALCWEIETMPPAPAEPLIDRETGLPSGQPFA